MIRELKEHHLQEAPKREIVEMVEEYSSWGRFTKPDVKKAADEVNHIRKMPAAIRGILATYLSSGELFCPECGETSCIHGYPDI